METLVRGFEAAFGAVPLPLLQLWGGFAFLAGLVLMVLAFGGFTLRPGGRWGLGLERQSWDAQALASSLFTFVLVLATGYLGSFIVLVPGAQTFESLKDLAVFLCIVLFGYPALLVVPFAYGLSDLAEGVPPAFLLDWLVGYFINPACFWVAHQLIGRSPDFRRAATWRAYLVFVVVFMAIEPPLWGHICAGRFTAPISYGQITPALAFTTSITWVLAPFAMLAALPLARRAGLYWADIPGHVRHRRLRSRTWLWESGRAGAATDLPPLGSSLPIRLAISVPTIVLVLVMVGLTAYLTLRSAEADAHKLAVRLHEEVAENIQLRLDAHLAQATGQGAAAPDIGALLRALRIAGPGRVYVVDPGGRLVASSLHGKDAAAPDPVLDAALPRLGPWPIEPAGASDGRQFSFDVLTARPLSRETWLARVTAYRDRNGNPADWLLLTVLPEAYYLSGVREGNAESAKVLAAALALALTLATLLAALVTAPVARISRATRALAREGALAQPLPGSRLEELAVLSDAFNDMARQLGERTERLHLATSVASLGVWDWDIAHNRLTWDEAMMRQYGLPGSAADATYDTWHRMLVPEDRAQAEAAVQAALSGEREFDTQFRILRADGSVRVLRGQARVLRDAAGKPLRMVGVNYDITDRQRAEEELVRHRDHLEQLVAERTQALSVAAAQAEAATRAKSDFLANMSHEIRTPMNAVIGLTDLALRTEPTPRQRGYLERTKSAAMSLLAIINDILDFSKIEAGKLDLVASEFALQDVFDHVAALVAPRAQERGLELLLQLSPDTPTRLVGDAQRLEQVLVNLCTNAVKFTDAGQVVVAVRPLDAGEQHTTLRFAVRDTGIGIAPALQARLFQPFSQVDASVTRRHGGTGLGLAISRQLVELMGGAIGVDSTPGRGSEFWFTLPFGRVASAAAADAADAAIAANAAHAAVTTALGRAAPAGRSAAPPPAAAPPQLRGRRVLLVEDNEFNQIVAGELLRDVAGMQVTLAANGREALQRVAGQRFDAVLMDLQMPLLDGYQATRAMRADPALAALPIIAMTAHTMVGERQRCLDAGMNDHVGKPFHPETLFAVLARWIDVPGSAPGAAGSRHAPPDAAPPVDFALGMHHCAGREHIYERAVQSFLDSENAQFAPIADALREGDLERIGRLMHVLISSAGMLGAVTLSNTARTLHDAIGTGTGTRANADVAALVETLREEQQRVVAALRQHVAGRAGAA